MIALKKKPRNKDNFYSAGKIFTYKDNDFAFSTESI